MFFATGTQNEGLQNNVVTLRRGSKNSLFVDNRFDNRRTLIVDRSHRQLESTPTSNTYRSPSRSSTPSSEEGAIQTERGEHIRKTKDLAESSSLLDRKMRRLKFAVREGERSQ